MPVEKIQIREASRAQLVKGEVAPKSRGADLSEEIDAHGTYYVECVGPDGEVKWSDVVHNIVTTGGRNDILDKYFSGAAYTASVVMGLKGSGVAVLADTQGSHGSWQEVGGANAPVYSGNRKTPTWNSAAGSQKSTAAVVTFTFSSGGTVAGCFLNNGGSATKDNTTGVLYSAGDFTNGSKTVDTGDSLNVTYVAAA